MSRAQSITGAVVLTAWFVSLMKGIVSERYQGLELTTPAMLTWCAFVFGDQILQRRKRGSDE